MGNGTVVVRLTTGLGGGAINLRFHRDPLSGRRRPLATPGPAGLVPSSICNRNRSSRSSRLMAEIGRTHTRPPRVRRKVSAVADSISSRHFIDVGDVIVDAARLETSISTGQVFPCRRRGSLRVCIFVCANERVLGPFVQFTPAISVGDRWQVISGGVRGALSAPCRLFGRSHARNS